MNQTVMKESTVMNQNCDETMMSMYSGQVQLQSLIADDLVETVCQGCWWFHSTHTCVADHSLVFFQ